MSSPAAKTLGVVVLGAILSGCASTGGLSPQAALRDANALAADRSLGDVPVTAAGWPRADWWKTFADPQLDALMQEALAGSPTLRIAAARTRKALAVANSSRAALRPQVDGSFSATRERFPETGLIPPPYGGTWQTLYDAQATLTWDLDLWGKDRAAFESALGMARASEVDAQAAKLALSTRIAQAYVELQGAYLQLDVAQADLEDRERIRALTIERHDAGLDSQVEVKQAESSVPAARVRIAQLEERIALTRGRIAALMGEGPDRGLAIARPTATVLLPMELPSTLPAELLGRRPDVVAQRWRIEAARTDIASARARFYPNVNLMAFVGLQSLVGGNFLTAASRTVGVAPAISLPIFDGGRLRGNLAGKDADYDIAVEQYNQTLADAMSDVVDQVASLRSLEQQRVQNSAALATAAEARELALLRYRAGLGNYLQVLSAEQPLLAQRSLDADLRVRHLQLSINLIRALGGAVL